MKFYFTLFLLLNAGCNFSGCVNIEKPVLKKDLILRSHIKDKHSYKKINWRPHKTAIIIVDMWDKHHCIPSENRGILLAKKINHFLPLLRENGVQVIFAPSDVMPFYADTVNRKNTILIGKTTILKKKPLVPLPFEPPTLVRPGCEDEKQNFKGKRSQSKQSDFIKIEEDDLISDSGSEIINILINKKIDLVLYAGVHSNVCILSRPFGMRELRRHGFKVVLIRDLTDSYSSKSNQFPYQKERNKEVINHIESYIGPTIHSSHF